MFYLRLWQGGLGTVKYCLPVASDTLIEHAFETASLTSRSSASNSASG